jgi:aldose 1-epimerase
MRGAKSAIRVQRKGDPDDSGNQESRETNTNLEGSINMKNRAKLFLAIGAVLAAVSFVGCSCPCGKSKAGEAPGQIGQTPFGVLKDGTPIHLFTLKNRSGTEAKIMNFGGVVVSLKVPDRNGKLGDVVLGYDNLAGYLKESPYFGAIVGRYANRIAKGKFTLDGVEYTLATNNGPNALHGGLRGFDKVVWEPAVTASAAGPSLQLKYVSKDGEEGYPGNLSITAIYTLTHDNALKLEVTATSDKETVVNISQHSYFNLAGQGTILNHEVMMPADRFTPVDSTLIPTGELRPVEGTPFDFRSSTPIGARINQPDEQLKFGNGYDHNWVFTRTVGEMGLLARVHEPTSGRVLEVLSTEPGLQFYSGNFLDGSIRGKGGQVYNLRDGFCMEPQHFPDSPNHRSFPPVVLKPGQVYRNTIVFRFLTDK